MVKLNITILLSSFLLIGCSKKVLNDNKTLYITSGYNKQKIFSNYYFENGHLKEMDSIVFNDSTNSLSFDSRFSNIIIDKKIISSYGIPFDLNKKETVLMDSLGHKILSRGFLLNNDGSHAYFYNFNNKKISKYDIKSNKFTISQNSRKFELQLLNSLPSIDYISPDYKNVIKIGTNSSNDFNKPCDIFVKNIETDKDVKIISSVYGTSMSPYSSIHPMPSIKWINDNEFIYTDYKQNDTITNCVVKKYNLLDRKSLTLGEINSIPLSNSNSTFQFDSKKNLYLNCKKGIFQIDYLNNKVSQTEIKYQLGDDFIISQKKGISKISYNNKIIFSETDSDKLDIHWNNFKSTKGYLAIVITRKNKNSNGSKKLFKVWSEASEEWLEFKKDELTSILGWTDTTKSIKE